VIPLFVDLYSPMLVAANTVEPVNEPAVARSMTIFETCAPPVGVSKAAPPSAPRLPSVSRPEHAAAVVAVEAVASPVPAVHQRSASQDLRDRSYGKRTLRVSERCPARSSVSGFSKRPLGQPRGR